MRRLERRDLERPAASTGQMGGNERAWRATTENLEALNGLSVLSIDNVQAREPPKLIAPNTEASEGPTYGSEDRRKAIEHLVARERSRRLVAKVEWRPGAAAERRAARAHAGAA